MLGENILQTLQKIATVAHRLEELSKAVDALKAEVNAQLNEHDGRLRVLEIAVARLEEARATQREIVRAEITAAVAELRVRYAEEQAQRQKELSSAEGTTERL